MMGRQDEPERLFYEFRLESHVPRDHLLRGIDAVTDFSEIRKLPIAGFVVLALKARFPIIRPSRKLATDGFVKASFSVVFSRRWCAPA
jgi:hypothetical protein